MRKLLPLLLLTALLTAACGGGGPSGTYALDTDAMMKAMGDQEMPEEILEQMISQFKMDMVLNDDKTFAVNGSMMGQTTSLEGTWKLEADGKTVTFSATKEDGVVKDPPDVQTGTLDGSKLVMQIEGMGETLTFIKK